MHDGVDRFLDFSFKSLALVALERIMVVQTSQPFLMQAWQRNAID